MRLFFPLLLAACGAARPIPPEPPPPRAATLDASALADAFVLAGRQLAEAGPTDACWIAVIGPEVPAPETGARVLLSSNGVDTPGFLVCGADPFPDLLLGRARFLIATVTGAEGYLIASSFGRYGASYSPQFIFASGAVELVLGDDNPDAVTLLELVAPGYETTDNALFSIFAEGAPEPGDAPPDLDVAMRTLFAHRPIEACADGAGGVLSAELGVAMDGRVARASFWASSLASPEADACMVEALHGVTFLPSASPWIFSIALQPDLWLGGAPVPEPTP